MRAGSLALPARMAIYSFFGVSHSTFAAVSVFVDLQSAGQVRSFSHDGAQ